jgi:hypothetical protein
MKLPRPSRPIVLALAVLSLSACTPDEIALYRSVTDSYREVVPDDRLERLRVCESHGNYEAISSSGRYRGAYQFSQSTWDRVATDHFPWLVGVDPSTAEPWWQDAMARALWSDRGPSAWPICGRRA